MLAAVDVLAVDEEGAADETTALSKLDEDEDETPDDEEPDADDEDEEATALLDMIDD